MKPIPGFENLAVIKRDYQWYDLNTRKYGPIKKGQRYNGGKGSMLIRLTRILWSMGQLVR